jgi:hypothetical protein
MMWLPGQRVLWPEALDIAVDPDLVEVVHPLGGDRHRATLVSEELEVSPERRTGKRDVAEADPAILQYENLGARSGIHRLLDRPVDVDAVGFVVAGDVNDGPIRHALEQPADPTFHARDEVAGDHEHIERRARVSRRQVPPASQFHM